MQAKTIWRVALAFFIISAVLGLVLRLIFFKPIAGLNYQYLLHTHSHIILLGWVFNALMAGVHFMLFRNKSNKKFFVLFLLFQISLLGMLFTFPFQGYAALSITFSTLHIVLSYFWAVWVWREAKSLPKLVRAPLKAGLIYLVLSTIGPFSLGPIIAKIGPGSDTYFMAIYYYLHFLYNGAFIFMLISLFFWLMNEMGVAIKSTLAERFLLLMNISCVLGVSLSALWMKPPAIFYIIGAVAGLVQLVALGYLFKIIKPIWPAFKQKIGRPAQIIFHIVILSFALKVFLQAFSAIPSVASLAYEVRNYTVGYLHLVFLGVLSPFLLAWFNVTGLFSINTISKKLGLGIFLVGYLITEVMIVSQKQLGIGTDYYQLLFGFSVLLLVGIVLLALGKQQNKLR
ncbi:hypothetical protein [Roseivirga echinicomitans]